MAVDKRTSGQHAVSACGISLKERPARLEKDDQSFSHEDVDAARKIPVEDDEVDAFYNQVYRELMMFVIADPRTIERANWLLWAAHNLERLADRVSNICEPISFIVTGELVEINASDTEFWKNQKQWELHRPPRGGRSLTPFFR